MFRIRVLVVVFVLQYQAARVCGSAIEGVPCKSFIPETCQLALRSTSSSYQILGVDSISWFKFSIANGELIVRFTQSGLVYEPAYLNGRFVLNITDGSLTINDVSFDDNIEFCFSGSFQGHAGQSYYSTACVNSVIQVPVSKVRLCREQASGSSTCVERSSDGTEEDVSVADLNVVSGVPVELLCSTVTCIRPGATFELSVGDRRLHAEVKEPKQCMQSEQLLSSIVLSYVPDRYDHGMCLSCTAWNRDGEDEGVTVSFNLDVNVPAEPNRLTIVYNGIRYSSGDAVSIKKDEQMTFACTASGTRPAAGIAWFIGGSPYKSTDVDIVLQGAVFDTTAYLKIDVKNKFDLEKLYCTAKTTDMEVGVSVFVSLVVQHGTSTTAILGGVLGTLTFVILVLVVTIVVKKRRKVRRRRKEQVSTIHLNDRNKALPAIPRLCCTSSDLSGPPVSERPCTYPADTRDGNSRYATLPATQHFPRSKLSVLNEIGQGNFGTVYLASADDILQMGSKTYVALKTLKENAGKDAMEKLVQEVDLMRRMESHPNVVRLLGCCLDKEPLYMIVEYLSNGNLLQYLRQNRAKDYTYIDSLSESVSSTDLLKFARDVASGMAFLTSNKCIHRDLAARNVLVAGDKVCKISDFGLACDISNSRVSQKSTDNCLPLRWMALESIDNDAFTTKSDVWSFGIVLWEIVTFGSRPFPNMGIHDVVENLRAGYRMPKPIHCDEKLYAMMLSCWDVTPDRRPRFAELLVSLETFLESQADYIVIGLYEEGMYLTPISSERQHEKL